MSIEYFVDGQDLWVNLGPAKRRSGGPYASSGLSDPSPGISGMTLKLEPDDWTLDGSSTISQWNDSSGAGNNWTQSVAGSRPPVGVIGTINAADTSNGDFLQSSTAFVTPGTAFSIYVVAMRTANSFGYDQVLSLKTGSGGSPFKVIWTSTDANYSDSSFGASTTFGNLKFSNTSMQQGNRSVHVLGMRYNGGAATAAGSYTVTVDGVAQTLGATGGGFGTHANDSGLGWNVGGDATSEVFRGYISRVWIWGAKSLSTDEDASVIAYLKWRYGIA